MTWVAFLVSSIGALNWGFVVFFQFNLIGFVFNRFGSMQVIKSTYAVISIAGFYSLVNLIWFYMR